MRRLIEIAQLLAFCAAALTVAVAEGQDAQHQFVAERFLGQHENTYENPAWEYGSKVAEVPWDALPDRRGATTLPTLQDVLADTVNTVQPLVRQLPPQGATDVQLAAFHEDKDARIEAALSPFAGEVVSADFKVDNVMEATKIESRARAEDFPPEERYFIIGYFAPPAPNARGSLPNQSRTAASAYPHLIYIFSDDPSVLKWRRDESHSVIGAIQKVGMWIGTQNLQPQVVSDRDVRLQPIEAVQLIFVVKGLATPPSPGALAVHLDGGGAGEIVTVAQAELESATAAFEATQSDAQARLQNDATYQKLLLDAKNAAARKKAIGGASAATPQARLDAAAALTKAQDLADQYPEEFLAADQQVTGAKGRMVAASARLEIAKDTQAAVDAAARDAKLGATTQGAKGEAEKKQTPPLTRSSVHDDVAAAGAPTISGEVSLNGDLSVKIDSAKIGEVAWKDFMGGQAAQDGNNYFVVTVTVTNASANRKYDYMTWRGNAFADGELHDDIGNTYKQIDKGFEGSVGAGEDGSIYPGKSLTDVLVFELPVAGAKTLMLDLPGENVHVTGSAKFQIELPAR